MLKKFFNLVKMILTIMIVCSFLFVFSCGLKETQKEIDNDIEEKTIEYTVNFNTNCDKKIDSQTVKAGEKIVKPNSLTLDGFTFDGWYDFNQKKWDFDNDIVSSDITLNAKWIINEYIISFNTMGAVENLSIIKTKYGSLISKPNTITKSGYEFNYWFVIDNSNQKKWDFDNDIVTSDIELIAKWNKIEPITPNIYNVYINADNGSKVQLQEIVDGGHVTVLDTPIKVDEGYNVAFLGWYYNNGTEEVLWDFDNDTVTKDIVLVAKWEKYKFTVAFDMNGATSSNIDSIVVIKGSLVEKPNDPVKSTDSKGIEYKFKYWELKSNNSKWDFSNDVVNDDIVLVAKFDIISTEEFLPED